MCQGLPDGPCPYLRCDASVHSTIYDLFLCNDCERMRDEASRADCDYVDVAATAAPNASSTQQKQKRLKGDPANVVSKGGRKQSRRQDIKTTTLSCDNSREIALTVASSSHQASENVSVSVSSNDVNLTSKAESNDSDEVHTLKDEVCRLTGIVRCLTAKLDFVLSFLQLRDDPALEPVSVSTLTEAAAAATSTINNQRSQLVTSDLSRPTSVDATTDDGTLVADEPLWSDVLHRKHKSFRPASFQEAAATAVYVDQLRKKARERRLVVTGLERSTTQSDEASFAALCINELHIQSTQQSIVSSKRLGHPIEGKIQPLMIIMKQADQAQQIIESAKLLRKSSDPSIRDRVFINPHMTKAEAAAAYQVRLQRRLALQRRGPQEVSHQATPNLSNNILYASNLTRASSEDPPTNCLRANGNSIQSSLNPSAKSFNASAATAGSGTSD